MRNLCIWEIWFVGDLHKITMASKYTKANCHFVAYSVMAIGF